MADTQVAATPAATAVETPSTAQGTEVGTAQQQTAMTEKAIRELGADDMDALVTFNIDGKLQKLPLREALKEVKVGKQARTTLEKRRAEFAEAQQAREQMAQFVHLAKTNPRKFLEMTGHDPYAFSEKTLTEKLKMMQMSPEARAAAEAQDRAEKAEARLEEIKQQNQRAHWEREEQNYANSLDQEMTDAFSKSGLPKHKWYVQMAANEMIGATQRGEDLSASDAIAIVRDRVLSNDLPTLVQGMDLHQILELLGPDKRKAIREYEVQEVQHQGRSQKETRHEVGTPPKSNKGRKVFSTDAEYRDWVESLKG